jgi:hypothetical protein
MQTTQVFNITLPHTISFNQSFIKHTFVNKTNSMMHCYLNKLLSAQLISCLLWNVKFPYYIHNSQPPVHMMN